MADRATADGEILVRLDEDELRFDPREVAIDDGATAGAPRVAGEDRIFFIKALRRLATAHSDPTDPRARLRKLRRELGSAGGSEVGDVAPTFDDQAAELRRLTTEAGDLGAGVLVEAPAEIGYLETGEIPSDLGRTPHDSRSSHDPREVFDPWDDRSPVPGAPRPGGGSPPSPGEGRGTGGAEPSEGEQGPSIDIGTIAWVLLILAFILLQLVGGQE